jgi:hypothetical protein
MAQVVSCWPLTAESRVCAWVNPCGIYGGQSGAGTGFPPSSLVFPHQYHSIIWGMNNMSISCSSSEMSHPIDIYNG